MARNGVVVPIGEFAVWLERQAYPAPFFSPLQTCLLSLGSALVVLTYTLKCVCGVDLGRTFMILAELSKLRQSRGTSRG